MPAIRSCFTRPLVLATLLALAPAMFLQKAVAQSRIEQQMTPEQFRATGLDQLTPEQLTNLNAWLNRTLDTETTKAAVAAKKKVEDDNRGLVIFGSFEPITGRVSGEFRGFGQGRRYVLDNGQEWEQTDGATLAGVRLSNPQVKITPSRVGNAWYLAVEGYNSRAKVQRVK